LFSGYASRAFLPSLKVVPLECGTPAVLVEGRGKREEGRGNKRKKDLFSIANYN